MYTKQNKVLIINDTNINFGGAESYVDALNKLLIKYGYNSKVFASSKNLSLRESFFSRWYSFKYFNLICKYIDEFKPDIIHIHNFSRVLSPSVIKAASMKNIPVIQTVHDYHYICSKLWMIDDDNKIIEKHDSYFECLFHHLPKKNILYSAFKGIKTEFHKIFLHNYVNQFICPSKELMNWYKKSYGLDKVTFLPNFVEESVYKYSKIKYYDKILYVGRLNKEKGVDILLKAFVKLTQTIPNIDLTIVGSGIEKQYLEKLSQKLNISEKIRWVSIKNKSELAKFYKNSTIIVIPSIWLENCPMVALEALSCGRPIVASDCGGLKDIIINNKTGLLFKRGNVKDLYSKMLILLSNKLLLDKINKNQKFIANNYHGKRHIEVIKKIYSSQIS